MIFVTGTQARLTFMSSYIDSSAPLLQNRPDGWALASINIGIELATLPTPSGPLSAHEIESPRHYPAKGSNGSPYATGIMDSA